MYDIVYILKQDIDPYELRYSLRSVEANFPHRKVWFFCGRPDAFNPDGFVCFAQKGRNKWYKATSSFQKICETGDVSDDFWLFNDDFFVLDKVNELPYMFRGMLEERIAGLRAKFNVSGYANYLEIAKDALEQEGLTTFDYALHVPMLINKRKAMEVIDAFPECPMFRSLYGNYWQVGGVKVKDCKIYDLDRKPSRWQTFVSTTDSSFKHGNVGRYIREKFKEPSKWEIQDESVQHA